MHTLVTSHRGSCGYDAAATASAIGTSAEPPRFHGPLTVALLAGCGGMGASTLAAHLAGMVSSWGLRAAIVMTNPRLDAHVGQEMNVNRQTILDLQELGPAEWWHRATLRMPNGVHVLAIDPSVANAPAVNLAATADTIRPMLAHHPFDLLLLDVGHQSPIWQTMWAEAAHQNVLLTTTETIPVLETYRLIKQLIHEAQRTPMGLVLNQVRNEELASACEQRIVDSCCQFLGIAPRRFGRLPYGPAIEVDQEHMPAAEDLDGASTPWHQALQMIAHAMLAHAPTAPTVTMFRERKSSQVSAAEWSMQEDRHCGAASSGKM